MESSLRGGALHAPPRHDVLPCGRTGVVNARCVVGDRMRHVRRGGRMSITLRLQDAARAYASAVQRIVDDARAVYAGDESSPAAQRDMRLAAQALERSDGVLADAYAVHKRGAE